MTNTLCFDILIEVVSESIDQKCADSDSKKNIKAVNMACLAILMTKLQYGLPNIYALIHCQKKYDQWESSEDRSPTANHIEI